MDSYPHTSDYISSSELYSERFPLAGTVKHLSILQRSLQIHPIHSVSSLI